MVHGLAEQSGGKLILRSRKGEGTRAEIWLPVAEAREAGEAAHAAEPASLRPALKRLSVMVVDDDPLVLMNTAALLEDLGHEVIEASCGQQALDLLSSGTTVDVVVTDQAMPGMTGVQVATAIGERWPMLPVILATGYAELAPESAPGLPRLSKPFRQQALAQALTDALAAADQVGRVVPFRPRHG
jgi:CheY-like chemotaxis protein